MKVINKGKRIYQHSYLDEKQQLVCINIAPNEIKEVDEEIAKAWLASKEVVEYSDPVEVKEEREELLEKIAKLEAENKKLKEKPASKPNKK